jgi:hypothetical protein
MSNPGDMNGRAYEIFTLLATQRNPVLKVVELEIDRAFMGNSKEPVHLKCQLKQCDFCLFIYDCGLI